MEVHNIEPLNMVLVESALELVPREIWHHPVVKRHARRRGKKPWEIILDRSVHHKAMLTLPLHHKRGRPDIVHISLLNAFSSPLNKVGLLNIYVHTIDNRLIFFDKSVRLPRHYYRFLGLMEQLLVEGKVPPNSDRPLIWYKRMTLKEFVDENKFEYIVLLDEKGLYIKITHLGEKIVQNLKRGIKTCIFIGGFPHGDFSEETKSLAHERISIYRDVLDTWVVVSRIIEIVELLLDIYS